MSTVPATSQTNQKPEQIFEQFVIDKIGRGILNPFDKRADNSDPGILKFLPSLLHISQVSGEFDGIGNPC